MKAQTLLLCLALAACLLAGGAHGKTVFRRTDKISENFKQLDLPAEEVDPNVAPPAPQQLVDTIDPEDVSDVSGTSGGATAPADDAEESAPEVVGTAVAADEVVDESANEVDAATPVAAPAAAASAVTPSTAESASASATTPVKNEDDPTGLSKYCKCTETTCDCCRTFGLPILPVRGPGCAKISYLGNEKMSVSIKYGDITLAKRTISGKNARPICIGLPGGYSQFCGRIYGLSKAKENFKACLGFELRADDEIEAALRVSCFKFGPDGLRVAEAEPLPSELNKDEDDYDEDDIFGFGAGDDDDDDDYGDDEDENENEDEADEDDEDDYGDDEDTEAPEDADYGGFSLGGLLSELADDDEETTVSNKPSTGALAADAATRAVTAGPKDAMQSKDDKGTEAAAADTSAGDSAAAVLDEAVAAATPAPEEAAAAAVATTAAPPSKKGKRAKKAKKNKKKKSSSDTDYAFEIINGILELFN